MWMINFEVNLGIVEWCWLRSSVFVYLCLLVRVCGVFFLINSCYCLWCCVFLLVVFLVLFILFIVRGVGLCIYV